MEWIGIGFVIVLFFLIVKAVSGQPKRKGTESHSGFPFFYSGDSSPDCSSDGGGFDGGCGDGGGGGGGD
ncbi:hypothetical protein CEF21_07950 [Bacillus sp. FJAT-42376]|uniref:hypothetical protein n=1 Tax=Bacillus sp. FJAT-42376 TaxID=2014076 RepID=UPI000F4EAD80|nr:hypothetical protein [Bacillus sp. FJAT-42376]AZB42225.1 hypothetical protein CEF21_07950 [Bacillus sp. FJAT-42376]